MAYGDQITEAIPTPIGNPIANQTYALTGVAYDVSIGGQPFFLNNDDNNPYRRITAQYRKNQVDMSREPGEQTITGWWLRSQSSFHLGQGIKFFEPSQDELLRFQYTYSKGCNIWTKGQVTLLNDTDTIHEVDNVLQTNGRPFQYLRSIKWKANGNSYQGALLSDGYDVDRIYPTITASVTNKALTSNVATLTATAHTFSVGMEIVVTGVDAVFNGTYAITAVTTNTFSYAKTNANIASTAVSPAGTVTSDNTHFVDYISGVTDPVYSICDDGIYAYWVTNDVSNGKLQIQKKLLSDGPSVAPTVMFSKVGITVVNAVIEYVKERLVLAVNNQVYEFATSASSLPSVTYTHPTADFTYTSITASGAAIYLSGYSGIQSTIQKFTLSTSTGSMPTLTSAITAAELPAGEINYKIFFYLNYLCIGTNKGVRIADISTTDGSVAYGPLIFESSQPVYDFTARDKYLWCVTGVDGNPGTTRIDLGTQLGSNLVFAYAWDLYDPNTTGFTTTACTFLGDTNRLVFTTANNGVANGKIYIQAVSRLLPQGKLQGGYVRFNTLENKIFKYLTPRCNTADGGLDILSVDAMGTEYNIGSFSQGTDIGDVSISYPPGSQQYLSFQFKFTRSVTDDSKGPLFTGYQVKVLLAVPRQRLIQLPLECYDSESDKFGNKSGYDGSAYNRIKDLETIESNGDTIKIEDFRTSETLTGIIEEIDFINRTPTDKRYSGYGGLLLVTIRTLS